MDWWLAVALLIVNARVHALAAELRTTTCVRSEDAVIAAAIAEADEHSFTFRSMVDAVEATDGLVYVREGICRLGGLSKTRQQLYLPAAQFQMTATMLVLRTTASIELVASLARDQVLAVDRDAQVMRVVPFVEMLDRPLARHTAEAALLQLAPVW